MKYDIITFGVPMVEIMRKELDVPLGEPGDFLGPFPAGDPGITLNACVAQGHRGAYVGVLGADALGECFLACMRERGVATEYLRVDPHHVTGLSLLAKHSDDSRDFVFTLPHSAAAQLGPQDLDDELLRGVRWVHLSGFAMSISDSIAQLHAELLQRLPDHVRVSFDPNYRKEVIALEEYQRRCADVFARCDLFLPSGGEAVLFCPEADNDLDACRRIAHTTGKPVALKLGSQGSWGFHGGEERQFPALLVEEKDPTGAGDTFGGALIAHLLDGDDFFTAQQYGTAAGAYAVTQIGLMNAAPSRAQTQALLDRGQKSTA